MSALLNLTFGQVIKARYYPDKITTLNMNNTNSMFCNHQTAGSSLQNIFLRYGERNDLNFALPKGNDHVLYGKDWDLIGSEYNINYHLFLLHTRW